MPRNPAGPSTLRNRNRVTNKTRLKVIKESIDADPIVLDEDEEKARVVSTAGVDAEDANEHHLQAVLSAAATRHQSIARSTRAATDKDSSQPAAFIPTPDSTGIVQNYEDLYPPKRWHDPTNYVKSSDTLEECTSSALVGGFIYYMDERDKDWLDRNNEEARGEGTSAQGAISGSTRSARSSKAKGKEPEVSQPVVMTEDEFELVMAVFEKVTHEKTEFLHHGLEQGGPFPPFTDYQDAFSTKLQPDLFALYEVPSWVPDESKLLPLARAVYAYWRERRLERGGHPIIPAVNLDETDTKNESYICFRRREIKAVRKTRAQQATYSDRLLRLKHDLERALLIASDVKDRELTKRESAVVGQVVWDKRFALVDLKRRYPTLGTKEDEELLHDKERIPKKAKTDTSGRPIVRLHAGSREPAVSQEPIMHPKAKLEIIQKQIESEMVQRKEKDHHWEDAVDNAYQATPTSYSSRLFKFIQSTRSTHTPDSPSSPPQRHRAARLRFGRGGRIHLDRRLCDPRSSRSPSESDSDTEVLEKRRRLQERWKFDEDDVPAIRPEGLEEQDRKLADDFDPKYLSHRMSLLSDSEYNMLMTDTSFYVTLPDGRVDKVTPYRLGVINNRNPAGSVTPRTPGGSQPPPSRPTPNGVTPVVNGTAISLPTPLKSMPPPPTVPSLRISANGTMRSITPSLSPTVPSHRPSSSPVRDQTHSTGIQDDPGSSVKSEQELKMTVPSQANGPDAVK
ncbi:hypothetical protein QCA50_013874 [Cerrena zonata]|uniref:Enhancer of polycomb-like protein n=1 Tax=Cerrena zonata TaxID=2478898 RepID=A0AAW0FQR0_9APHY